MIQIVSVSTHVQIISYRVSNQVNRENLVKGGQCWDCVCVCVWERLLPIVKAEKQQRIVVLFEFPVIDAWLNPVFLRPPGRVSRSLCASLSRMKQTKAGERGSELFGRVPDRSHWHICMWNRHFTPPHFLIVAKIICEIAFHQECFPRQLSHNFTCGGPTELTHAPLLFLPHVRFLEEGVDVSLTITSEQYCGGAVNLLSYTAGRPKFRNYQKSKRNHLNSRSARQADPCVFTQRLSPPGNLISSEAQVACKKILIYTRSRERMTSQKILLSTH